MRFPIPDTINSLRDFYAFEQHVKTARANRGRDMIPQWYEFPVFYYSNHRVIYRHGETIPMPGYTEWLDYELELAFILGKGGINITAEAAMDYVAGITIMNDWSARDIQRREMQVGLGPAKGKDFATSLGPEFVTIDELESVRIGEGADTRYDLEMTAKVNGKLLSRGNAKDIYFTFAQMIAHASADTMLYEGDVMGSGTVGTGCLLELRGEESPLGRWLQVGDVVTLEIEGIGILENTVGGRRVG
jgi:fumarylacetoacetate (FAA) hydrolase